MKQIKVCFKDFMKALGGNHGMKGRKKTFDGLSVKELERVG